MCGIAGVVGHPTDDLIASMTHAQHHRGPDGAGWAGRSPSWVGATRLAIVDLAAPAQPIFDESGETALVINGEIYNHRELRAELIARGHRFTSMTDSEVVVHLWEERGPACLAQLRGMFAFAILGADSLFLVRDRLGIKPLYYAVEAGGRLLFASEQRTILQHRAESPRLDLQAFADSLVLGHPVGDETFFEGVRLVPAGHWLRVTWAGGVVIDPPVPYVHPLDRDDAITIDEAEALLDAALDDAVRRHLDADVEVALTLSGGIDSTMLGLVARDLTDEPLRTYTIADHPTHPDVVQAESVAALIEAKHRTVILDQPTYLSTIPRLVQSEEAPASLFALPFQHLCEHIAGDVRACLHGEGADELLGGYPEYTSRDYRMRAYQRRLPLLERLGIAPSGAAVEQIQALSIPQTMSDYVQAVFDVNLGDQLQRQHLDVVDRASMSVGLEMRVPYLDDELVRLACSFPTRHLVRLDLGVRKYLLRRLAVHRFLPTYGPALLDIVLREKLGAPTAGLQLLDQFHADVDARLPEDYNDRHELGFCFSGKDDLLVFEYFCELFLRHRGDISATGGIADFIEARSMA